MATEKPPEPEKMIWLREEPSARRPSHTRREIAEAALAIADSEGFDAVSMRRVAQELDAGTMTLYHYVRNKDELIMLMVNAVVGETLIPEEELIEGSWREQIRQIALRRRETYRRHRWALERFDYNQPVPNSLYSFEQSLRACASLDISPAEKFELVSLVDDYIFGYALHEAREIVEQQRGWTPEVVEFYERQLESEEHPEFRRLLGDDIEAGFVWAGELFLDEGRFERGLDRLLEGIEAGLEDDGR
ncbi:MAG TPA: TetR/AcrR family transcriptional regulator [Solirubrobacterales bacterium]|nr:TetR/AcrR family transcriptional regulator [Solirubrobacterales bacterium]